MGGTQAADAVLVRDRQCVEASTLGQAMRGTDGR